MRRPRVEFRPSANVDIAAIFEYIFEASRSSAVAGRFVRRIRDRCERIGDVPLGGRPRDDLAPGAGKLEEAVAAYREALKELTRERASTTHDPVHA